MKETNELLSGESTNSRPSKSGVAGSSPAGPTKNKGVSDDPLAPPTGAGQGRELLNVGKTLEGTAAQIARLREMQTEESDAIEHVQSLLKNDRERLRGEQLAQSELTLTTYLSDYEKRLAALTAAADALEREAWCEEYQADVVRLLDGRWCVTFLDGFLNQRTYYASSRDEAIDRARGER